MATNQTYNLRLYLAKLLGRWSHRYLLTRQEILDHNQKNYDNWRAFTGLP